MHVGLASRCIRLPRTPGRTGSRSSASTPTACVAWRVRTLPGCVRAKAKDTFTVPAVRHHRVRGPRGQRPHPLAPVDRRDRHGRLALRPRRRTGHLDRLSQARDARGCRPTPPPAARPAGRARAARARRTQGSRSARARSFLSGAGTIQRPRRRGAFTRQRAAPRRGACEWAGRCVRFLQGRSRHSERHRRGRIEELAGRGPRHVDW